MRTEIVNSANERHLALLEDVPKRIQIDILLNFIELIGILRTQLHLGVAFFLHSFCSLPNFNWWKKQNEKKNRFDAE